MDEKRWAILGAVRGPAGVGNSQSTVASGLYELSREGMGGSEGQGYREGQRAMSQCGESHARPVGRREVIESKMPNLVKSGTFTINGSPPSPQNPFKILREVSPKNGNTL